MKFLIYFTCLLVQSIIQVLFKYAGLTLGGIPSALLMWGTLTLAFKLCELYDDEKLLEAASATNLSVIEFVKSKTPDNVLELCESLRGKPEEIKNLLKKARKKRLIKRVYVKYLQEEYEYHTPLRKIK